jgi:t-SNARE complex subunit (syntaxin)
MKRVSVNITKEMLDEAVRDQVRELEKEIKNLKSQNAQLRKENKRHKENAERVQIIVQAVVDAGFCEGYC